MDNEQFQFAHALKPAATSAFAAFVDKCKTFFVTKVAFPCSPFGCCAHSILSPNSLHGTAPIHRFFPLPSRPDQGVRPHKADRGHAAL